MKVFKSKTNIAFNKGNLIYNGKEKRYYKVVDLKTDESYKPTWASLVSNDGSIKIEISTEEQFEDYQDFIDLHVVVSPATKEKIILLIRQKIYDKFESGFESAFIGIGALIMAYKLFFKGMNLDKSQCPAQIWDINDGDYIRIIFNIIFIV